MEQQYIERGIYKVRQDGTKDFVAFKTREEKHGISGTLRWNGEDYIFGAGTSLSVVWAVVRYFELDEIAAR
jgi:hypothetical protein